MRLRSALCSAAVLAATLVIPSGSAAAASCAPAEHPGGSWPLFGGSADSTRSQPAEDTIHPGNVSSLAPVWSFNTAVSGNPADVFTGSPVVAEGCVYAGGPMSVYAINADTGELVWATPLEGGVATGTTLAVDAGRVFAHGTTDGHPSTSAFDSQTGEHLWTTILSEQPNANASVGASPVAFNGLVLSGIQGGLEFTEEARATTNGNFSLLDAATGEVLERTFVIPEEDFAEGYTGGNIWATAAVDLETGHAYFGTAAPYSEEKQHPRTNAILKVDVDPQRDTFGEVVDFYTGTPDYYFHFQEQLPCTPGIPGSNTYEALTGTCAVQDLDFGASPNLWTDAEGRTIVGEVQKSGIFHALDTETMEPVWTAFVAAPHGAGTLNSTAVEDGVVFGSGSYFQNHYYALDTESGDTRWLSAAPDTLRASPVSAANGVVYSANTDGLLSAHDARTGLLLLARPVPADAGTAASGLGTGVAIARNLVFAVGGGGIVAYAPNGSLPDTSPVLSEVPTPPTLPRQEQPPV